MVQFTKTVSVLLFYFLEICFNRKLNKNNICENNKILHSCDYLFCNLGIF